MSVSRKAWALLALIILSIFLMLAGQSEANTQRVCFPRGQWLEMLADEYGEVLVMQGVFSDGSLFEVLSSTDGKSFSVFEGMPDGQLCLRNAGTDLEIFDTTPLPEGDDT